jgi:hypothetical protein
LTLFFFFREKQTWDIFFSATAASLEESVKALQNQVAELTRVVQELQQQQQQQQPTATAAKRGCPRVLEESTMSPQQLKNRAQNDKQRENKRKSYHRKKET